MYIVEIYDKDNKKVFVKDLDSQGCPSSFTKTKTDARRWVYQDQVTMCMVKFLTDRLAFRDIVSLPKGFKIVEVK
jgi:cellulose biosynthesis protein BcsQ